MKYWFIVVGLFLHPLAVFSLPTGSNARSPALFGGASINNGKIGGGGTSQKGATAVTNAASAFASDVAIVSSSLNGSE